MKRCASVILAALVLVLGCGAQAGQRDSQLDGLFIQLQATTDLAEAQGIQGTIWRIWIAAGEERVDAEMARGIGEMEFGDFPAALKHFDVVVEMAPDHAEAGTNGRRCSILWEISKARCAISDARWPLSPGIGAALSGLGLIHMRTGNLPAAIEAFEDAVAVNPHLLGTKLRFKHLKTIIKGRRTERTPGAAPQTPGRREADVAT